MSSPLLVSPIEPMFKTYILYIQYIIYIPASSLKAFESTSTFPHMPSLLHSLSTLDTTVNVLLLKYKPALTALLPKAEDLA